MSGLDAGGLGFNIACPICSAGIQTTLGAAEAGKTVICPHGHRIDLNPDHSVAQARRQIDQSFRKLERSLKRFGRGR